MSVTEALPTTTSDVEPASHGDAVPNTRAQSAELWGLDPMFRTHVKLFIKDVLTLEEVEGHPGVYMYRGRPVVRVDIQGVIVRVEERAKFYAYALDDGTGVISVTQWKPDELPVPATTADTSRLLGARWARLQQEKHERHVGYQLSQLLHVRGKLSLYSNMIQILASYAACVTDARSEIERMSTLPRLYTQCYNHPAQLPQSLSHSSPASHVQLTYDVESATHSYLQSLHRQTFTVKELMQVTAIRDLLQSSVEEVKEEVVCRVINNLEKSGEVFHRDEVYVVCSECRELQQAIVTFVTSWVDRTGDHDGCTDSDVYDNLHRQVAWSSINLDCVRSCLDHLEANSDVITTAHRRYITVNG